MDQQGIGDGLAHAQRWIEAGQRILEHHLQAAACPPQRLAPQAQQLLPLQHHPAAANGAESHQGSAQRAFAAAGGPHHPQAFAPVQLKTDAIHRFQPARRPGHPTDGMPAAHRFHPQHRDAGGALRSSSALPLPCGGQQTPAQGGSGGRQQLMAGAVLHRAAAFEHGHALAPAARHRQIVADQQQGTPQVAAEATEFCHHLVGHRHIQAGGGLIGDQQRWLQGNGQRDGQALTHPTTQLVGIGAEPIGADAHHLQQLLTALLPPCRRSFPTVRLQGVEQMAAGTEQRVQPGHRILEHQPCRPAPQLSQGGPWQFAWVLSHQPQPTFTAAPGGEQLQDSPGDGAFSTA